MPKPAHHNPSVEMQRRGLVWQAAVKKARIAFEELRYAERAYLAAVERHRANTPCKDLIPPGR